MAGWMGAVTLLPPGHWMAGLDLVVRFHGQALPDGRTLRGAAAGVMTGSGNVVVAPIADHGGSEVKTTGDGFQVRFDSPTEAVRCALAACEALRPLGLEIRAGAHTGEVELHDRDLAGLAVHIAARLEGEARPCEVVVSGTVKDLAIGSGLVFEDRGERELKGVPGTWHLYPVGT